MDIELHNTDDRISALGVGIVTANAGRPEAENNAISCRGRIIMKIAPASPVLTDKLNAMNA